ncbi:unknown protein [Waddlia chondrophila 2032/99]|uniref:Uncharacterized protein n=1 Tax=Waddlia chondrophila 2032/99 TaxID=765953 RepID=F8LE62_9BACT|nr:unknown protein [Waddlia chondrophila 2032/99]
MVFFKEMIILLGEKMVAVLPLIFVFAVVLSLVSMIVFEKLLKNLERSG